MKVYVDDCFKQLFFVERSLKLRYSTKCINNNRNPEWRDTQVFDIVADKSFIRLHVYDSDSHDNSTLIDPIGFVEFCIQEIPFDQARRGMKLKENSEAQVIDGWLELRFPGNLQGVNSDRYAEHMMQREEEPLKGIDWRGMGCRGCRRPCRRSPPTKKRTRQMR